MGIPLSNDQKSNLLDAKNRGIAYVVQWKGLSKEAFLAGIQSVLHNDKNRYVAILNIGSGQSWQFIILDFIIGYESNFHIFKFEQLSNGNKSFA